MRKLKVRIAAIFLLLVLLQGSGLRFIVHNTLHKQSINTALTDHAKGNVQMYCDCLDEALMPSTTTPAFELIVPQQRCVVLENDFRVSLTSAVKIFRSLRAPPSYTI
jgi:hypothetical protein